LSQNPSSWLFRRRIPLSVLFCVAAALAVAAMAYTGPAGWDAQIYWRAVQTLRHGGDPYAEGIAAQLAYLHRPASRVADHVPFTYVYSPMTLPLLRLFTVVPGGLLAVVYAMAVAGGFLLELWAGWQMASAWERKWLVLALPAIAFFPGLVTDDTILSGNIGYVLYGLVLAAAVPGWKRGRWFWYYIAVLAASIVKAPLLTMIAFPILVGKRQWLPAASTAAAGLALFAVQARIWPEQFREYLFAIQLMFDEVHDFGFGPAGVFGKTLWSKGLPYTRPAIVLYVISSCVIACVLLMLKWRVYIGKLSQERWIPIALVGTLLFYPRIMRYDLAAFAVPMLLIGWRTFRIADDPSGVRDFSGLFSRFTTRPTIFIGCLLTANVITVVGPMWFPIELMALLVVFALGVTSTYDVQAVGPRSDALEEASAMARLAAAGLSAPGMSVTFDAE
jgi:hypothetical protein